MYQRQTFGMSTVFWLLKHTNMMDERKCLEEKKEKTKEDGGVQFPAFMFILHECNQFHSEGMKWHGGYTLSAHALKEGWKTHTCNKISSKKKVSVW
jgi:hypothetical protein